MPQQIPWVYYVSEMGRAVVQREIAKMQLTPREFVLLAETLTRISNGAETWKDSDHLGDGIWEARVRTPRFHIRVLFSKETSPKVFLALVAGVKKVQKTPAQWISLAKQRHKDWLLRLNDAT